MEQFLEVTNRKLVSWKKCNDFNEVAKLPNKLASLQNLIKMETCQKMLNLFGVKDHFVKNLKQEVRLKKLKGLLMNLFGF